MMFATVDNAGGIYIPMCQHRPVLIVYFVAFLLLVSICLMNLVTAVIREVLMTQGLVGWMLVLVSANLERLVLGCIEANFASEE